MLVAVLVFLKVIAVLVASLLLVSGLFFALHPTFGSKPDAETIARIKKSPNFDGKRFVNKVVTNPTSFTKDALKKKFKEPDHEDPSQQMGLLRNFILPPKGKNPQKPIITEPLKFNAHTLKNGEFVWLGHSTVLFKTADQIFITDPVFHHAAPVSFAVRPFKMTHTPRVEDLPYLDHVIISHDHYDHLDHKAIKKIKEKVGHFYVPLGVKAHLVRWGVSKAKISEYDWYENVELDQVRLVFAPTRHFSGRGINNHRQTLWGSWVVQSPELKVYFSGDGGYSPEFAKIGDMFDGFDIAFIEDGAYNERWQDVHMLPEQSAQAGIDLRAKVVLPIHWGKYDLSTHQWTDPVKRIKRAMATHNASVADAEKIQIATPKIGQVFTLQNLPQKEWWITKES